MAPRDDALSLNLLESARKEGEARDEAADIRSDFGAGEFSVVALNACAACRQDVANRLPHADGHPASDVDRCAARARLRRRRNDEAGGSLRPERPRSPSAAP